MEELLKKVLTLVLIGGSIYLGLIVFTFIAMLVVFIIALKRGLFK